MIGRFLEHTRVYYFENGGDFVIYLSSADWMGRNFFNRIETCFPVTDDALNKRVLREAFTTYLADNCQSWLLQSDGTYRQSVPPEGLRQSAQETLLAELAQE